MVRTRKSLPSALLFGPFIFLHHSMLLLRLLLFLILQLLFLLLHPFSFPVRLFFDTTSRFLPVTVVVPLKRLSKFLLGKVVSFVGKRSDRGKISVFMEYQ